MRHGSSRPWLALMVVLLVAAFSMSAPAGPVGSLNTFSPGDVADANEVNANFDAIRTAVDDNDARIDDLVTSNTMKCLHFPANSLAHGASVTPDTLGLVVPDGQGVRVYLRKPPDYAGGDVLVTVVFSPQISVAGVVDFSVSHSGNDYGNGAFMHTDVDAPGVAVNDNEFVHRQTFTVPAASANFDVWSARIRRTGAEETYVDDVRVLCVDWQYRGLP